MNRTFFSHRLVLSGDVLSLAEVENREKRKERAGCFFWLAFMGIVLVGSFFFVQRVQAHGGGALQAVNVPIGSYQVSVWLNPPTVRTGQTIHLTVGVAAVEDGSPVLNSTVNVVIETAAGEEVLTVPATTEQSVNRLFYETDIGSLPAGSYEVFVQVVGDEGSGDLSFPMEVEQASVWPRLAGLLSGGVVIWFVVHRDGARGERPPRQAMTDRTMTHRTSVQAFPAPVL